MDNKEADQLIKDCSKELGKGYHPGYVPEYKNDPTYRALELIYGKEMMQNITREKKEDESNKAN